MTISSVSRVRALAESIRDQRRRRREARAAYLELERQLATYRTPREVDDLLGSIKDEDGEDAQQIRDMLLDNLRPTRELYRVS